MIDLDKPLHVLGLTLGAALSCHILLQRAIESFKPPLPPSPRSYPLIGNLLSMPRSHEYLAFMELGKQLKTDIFSLSVLGQTMIILNSAEDAIKLLQNRSAIYSDRPKAPMLTEPSLLDAGGLLNITPYGDRWRKSRRIMHTWLNKQAMKAFDHPQQHEARLLLQRLMPLDVISSEAMYQEVFTALSSTLLRSIYGYQVRDGNDPILKDAILMAHNVADAIMPTNFLVNIFPSLSYVPAWFPGAGWKRIAQEWREQKERTMSHLYDKTKEAVASGNYEPSIIASSLTNAENLGLSAEEIDDYLSYVGITLYLGGAETTSNLFLVFAIQMMLHPEIQQKAQAEIDSVIGDSRLPVMDDKPQLPYTNRLIQELLRWCPIAPAVPHATTDGDIYRDFRIPKGAIVFANIWAMCHDGKVYENPEEFNPDRYLDPLVPSPPAFGFGRRECPGNHFAESSAFIIIASLLAVFDIKIPINDQGEDIVPKLTSRGAFIYHPDEFKVKLELRSTQRAQLVHNEG